jgi:hypothetical protein
MSDLRDPKILRPSELLYTFADNVPLYARQKLAWKISTHLDLLSCLVISALFFRGGVSVLNGAIVVMRYAFMLDLGPAGIVKSTTTRTRDSKWGRRLR